MAAPKARGALASVALFLLLCGPAFAGGASGSSGSGSASGDGSIPPGPTGGPVSGPTGTSGSASGSTATDLTYDSGLSTATTIQQGQSFSQNAANAADAAQRSAANGVLLTLKGLNLLDAKHPAANAGVLLEQGAEALQTADDLAKYAVQNDNLANNLVAGDSPATAKATSGDGGGGGAGGSGTDLVPDSKILGTSSAQNVFKTFEGKYGVDSKDMVKEITATKANPADMEKTLQLPKGSIGSAIAAADADKAQPSGGIAGVDAETAAMIASLKHDAAKVLGNAQDATGTLVGAGASETISGLLAPERTTASQPSAAASDRLLASDSNVSTSTTVTKRLWSDSEFGSQDLSLFARVTKKYRERQAPLLPRK